MQLGLTEPSYGLGVYDLYGNVERQIPVGTHASISSRQIAQGVRSALDYYRQRTDGLVDFVQYSPGSLKEEPTLELQASGLVAVKYDGRMAGILQIIALGRHEGTGDSVPLETRADWWNVVEWQDEIDYLSTDAHRDVSMMQPVDKSAVYTEAYVPLLKIDSRRHRARITELSGGLDLLGYTYADKITRKIGKIATVQSNLTTLHDGPTPHVVAATSWVDLQGRWNAAPESARFAGASSYYNKYDSLQVFGLLQIFDPDELNVLRRLNTLDPKDRNPDNLNFGLTA